MSSRNFDPYSAQFRLRWHNQWQRWRAAPAEPVFHALVLLAIAALIASRAGAAADSLRAGLQLLWASQPAACALLLVAAIGWDHRAAARRHRRSIGHDWFAAQPVAASVRSRQRRWIFAGRLLVQLPVIVMACLWIDSRTQVVVAALTIAASAAWLGHWLGTHQSNVTTTRPFRRQLLASGAATLWRWQWIEATAALSPRSLALLLPAILLVPRGGILMAVAALVIVALLALAQAWRRSLSVLPAAHAWWHAQPVRPRDWWLRTLPLPLGLLATIAAALAGIGAGMGNPVLGLSAAGLSLMFGLLQLACVIAWLVQPRRAAFGFLLHSLLLLAVLQSLPPLVALLWPAQILMLLRKGLHR